MSKANTLEEQTMTTETNTQKARMRPWILTLLIVLALAAAILAAAALLLRDETTEEATFDMTTVTEIRTVVESGNVEIETADRSDIRVVSVLTSGLGSNPQSEVTLEAGVLSMESECESFLISTCRVTYRVTVPTDGALALDLETAAGNVDLSGASGPVVVRTTAGSIDVTDHVGEEADLRTEAGNVSFEASTPPTRLSIETTAGSITVEVPDVGYRIDTETTVGSINVNLDQEPDAEGTIEASTTAGSIELVGR